MMAVDVPSIDVALVCRLIALQFPQWRDLDVREVEVQGHDNRTFRLGDEMAVRMPSAGAYVAQVEKEHEWLPRLASMLPLEIPRPLAIGEPAAGYPWVWSVRSWIRGEVIGVDRIEESGALAEALGGFLSALWCVGSAGGPAPGAHNFHRGGRLEVYDAETRDAIARLGRRVDSDRALRVWEHALSCEWDGPGVWVHGDMSAQNLLMRDGRLTAVIDFGCCAVGDPACDLVIAWTLFVGESRRRFRARLDVDEGTWARARGWALWKALITLAGPADAAVAYPGDPEGVVQILLGEHGV